MHVSCRSTSLYDENSLYYSKYMNMIVQCKTLLIHDGGQRQQEATAMTDMVAGR